MIRKTLLVSLLSFLIVSIPIYFFVYRRESVDMNPDFFMESLAYYYMYITLPLVGGVFLVLLIFNLLLEKEFRKDTRKKRQTIYFLYSLYLMLAVIVVSLITYYQENGGGISQFFVQHLGYFIISIVAIIINRKINWKNFR